MSATDEVRISVNADGTLSFLYTDVAVDAGLLALGDVSITRASHVEPWRDSGTLWGADMAPVDGPLLGPFARRQEALAAEVAWLRDHRGL